MTLGINEKGKPIEPLGTLPCHYSHSKLRGGFHGILVTSVILKFERKTARKPAFWCELLDASRIGHASTATFDTSHAVC